MLFPNEGWESGDAGGWTFENNGWGVPFVSLAYPRSGLYSLCFNTATSNEAWGRARYAVPSAKVASLKGKTVTFKVWHWCDVMFSGGPGDQQYIRIDDGVGMATTNLPFSGSTVWTQVSVSRVIDASATKVEFIIYWLKAGGGSIFRIYEDDMESDPVSFPVVAPADTTDPATLITHAGSTLNGTLVDDGGEACDCGFEWGETPAYGNTTPTQSRTTGQTFAQAISGLDPNKTYHFRAFATNSAGTSYGADRTFTTLAALPTVTTDPAALIGGTTATLTGTLDYDGGEACDCGFEWGLTPAYGHTTPTDSKTTGQTFLQAIGALVLGTLYHFRAFATNSAGTSNGADRTFTTVAGIIAPTVTTNPVSGLGIIVATLNGTLDSDGGDLCQCGFEWGKSIPYTNTTPTQVKITGQTFSQIIAPLEPATVYHYRAFGTNSAGTAYGADIEIRTYPAQSRGHALSKEEL